MSGFFILLFVILKVCKSANLQMGKYLEQAPITRKLKQMVLLLNSALKCGLIFCLFKVITQLIYHNCPFTSQCQP